MVSGIVVTYSVPETSNARSVDERSVINGSERRGMIVTETLMIRRVIRTNFAVADVTCVLGEAIRTAERLFGVDARFCRASETFELTASRTALVGGSISPVFIWGGVDEGWGYYC